MTYLGINLRHSKTIRILLYNPLLNPLIIIMNIFYSRLVPISRQFVSHVPRDIDKGRWASSQLFVCLYSPRNLSWNEVKMGKSKRV